MNTATLSKGYLQELHFPEDRIFVESSTTTSASGNEPLIVKTSGVCGGVARIAGTRFAVWMLFESRDAGCTDAKFLTNYPHLSQEQLDAAWSYARTHEDELQQQIRENREA